MLPYVLWRAKSLLIKSTALESSTWVDAMDFEEILDRYKDREIDIVILHMYIYKIS